MHEQVVSRLIGDEMILLDTLSGRYFSLNSVGARIWTLAKDGMSRDAIRDVIVCEFEVDPATAELDMHALEGKLSSLNLSPFQ